MVALDRITGLVAACACALAACASTSRSVLVSTTNTTAAPLYTPGEVELYVARNGGQSACPLDLAPDVDFAPRTAALRPGAALAIDAWARCLNRPELLQSTIVLLGGDEPNAPPGLFVLRAQRVRDALVAHGVAAQRVLIGATNATREGGAHATRSGVRVEVTTASTLRAFPPQNKLLGLGVR